MTDEPSNLSYGNLPPYPVLELTLEQEFKLKEISIEVKDMDQEDLVLLFLQVMRRNYVLTNNMNKLLGEWGNK